MGWKQAELVVFGRISSHNSEQDRLDESAWEEFVDRVRMIAREHRYADLDLDVGAGE